MLQDEARSMFFFFAEASKIKMRLEHDHCCFPDSEKVTNKMQIQTLKTTCAWMDFHMQQHGVKYIMMGVAKSAFTNLLTVLGALLKKNIYTFGASKKHCLISPKFQNTRTKNTIPQCYICEVLKKSVSLSTSLELNGHSKGNCTLLYGIFEETKANC